MTFPDLTHLPIAQKIGQLFFIGISGPELDKDTKRLLADISPGGVCLFARNIKEAEQTRKLLEGIRQISAIEPFLSLDQEGGLVDRLRRVMTPMPAASSLRNASDARTVGEIIGEAIRLLGFNMDFAPVVDVIDESRSSYVNGLHSRAYGSSKEQVVEMSGAFLDGLESHGIIGCLKHFPGLAAAQVDSHEELPSIVAGDDELRDTDLYPYRNLLKRKTAIGVMVAHASYPNTRLQEIAANGKLLPSSLNHSIVSDLLRNGLGFKGVAVTDDLEMGAIVKTFGIGEACKLAINAGQDLLAICANPELIREGFAAVRAAVEDGEIAEDRIDESLDRIAALKSKIGPRLALDIDRLNHLSGQVKELNNHWS